MGRSRTICTHPARASIEQSKSGPWGTTQHLSIHSLRRGFGLLHMAHGTPLKWIQAQGGWFSAKMLFDVYGHFMPEESSGYADALSASPDGTRRHRAVGENRPRNHTRPE